MSGGRRCANPACDRGWSPDGRYRRGLCRRCYQREHRAGRLAVYPRQPWHFVSNPMDMRIPGVLEVRARNRARERQRVNRHEVHPARLWYWRRHLYARCFRPGPLPGKARREEAA